MDQIDNSSFSEHLIKSEPGNDALRRRYEEGKRALLERRLSPWQRRMGWFGLPLYGVLIVSGGYGALRASSAEPRELAVLDAVCAVGLLALGLWILRVLLRGGRVSWRDDQAMQWVGGLGLCALTFALFEFAGSLEDPRAALRLQGFSIVLLVGGVLALTLEHIRRAKLETRVKVLELELRVAELAQALGLSSPDVPTSRT